MTKAGVGFIIGGVVVYVLGSQTQVGWLYLFDAMIWSVLALSFFLTRWSLGPLRIERQALVSRSQDSRLDPATPVEGGTVEQVEGNTAVAGSANDLIDHIAVAATDQKQAAKRPALLPKTSVIMEVYPSGLAWP